MNNTPRDLDDHDPNEWGNVELPGMTDDKLHSTNWNQVTAARIRAQDPEWIKKITEINRARMQDLEGLAKHRAMMKSDEYKKAHQTSTQNEEYRKHKSELSKKMWQDPEYRKVQQQAITTPEVKEKQKVAAQKRETDPEYQKRKKEWSSKFKDNHERNTLISKKRKAYLEAHPEARQELSERAKRNHETRTKEDYDKIHDKRKASGWHAKTIEAGKKKMKPIVTPAGIFPSKKDAVAHYKFDSAMIDYWRRKKPAEWYHISQEQYILLTGKEI